jgi:peptidoglycan/LPS O-acetylase OafA/YrhL
MKLSDCVQGRDNNFNLIRILAALAVLVTHSFALSIGDPQAEPFRTSLGMTMGSIAVDVFFVTSGFLVGASLLKSQNTLDFILARALRIFPALWVMLVLLVFGLGLAFTTLSATDYLHSKAVYAYLLRSASLVWGVGFVLPGVFDTNPYPSGVNGSLWTLPFEVRMYLILALAWLICALARQRRVQALQVSLVAMAALSGLVVVLSHIWPVAINPSTLFFMFFTGSAFYVLRQHVRLNHGLFAALALALVLSAGQAQWFGLVYLASIAYVVFYLAYVPSGAIRHYNRLGDYSYGVYIYAFPVQQSIAAWAPGVSVLGMVILSATITIGLAMLSWHGLEKFALSHKVSCVQRCQFLLNRLCARLGSTKA